MKLILLLLTAITVNTAWCLSIGSYNIRNFDYDQRSHTPTDKNELRNILKEINTDIIAVQEIVQRDKFFQYLKNELPEYQAVLTDCGGHHGQRVGFIYKSSEITLLSFKQDLSTVNPFATNQIRECELGSRPMGVAEFKHKKSGVHFFAISVHLKSGGNKGSLNKRYKQIEMIKKAVLSYKKEFNTKNFVIMGDFNTTEYVNTYKPYKEQYQLFVLDIEAYDLSENLGCTSYWYGGRDDGLWYPSHLDHMLVSETLITSLSMPKATTLAHCSKLKCGITRDGSMGVSFDKVSDHCPLKAEF